MSSIRLALRGLRRDPGYAVAFILTLGLGIGANTAVFSMLNGVLLRPLPHEEGERIVYLRHEAPLADIENALFSVPEIDDYRQQAPSLDGVAEFSVMTFTLHGFQEPRRVQAGVVTGNYFDVLGLTTTRGRAFEAADDLETSEPVMVLSDRFWRNFFDADPEVIGEVARMNGRNVVIVGVLEPAPPYPEKTDVYVNMVTSPHHMSAAMEHERTHRMTEVFARLAPGATVQDVLTDTREIGQRLHETYPEAYDANFGYRVSVTPLRRQLAARAQPMLLVLLAASAFVLVVSCANVANLTMARLSTRANEIRVRAALGASRTAIRRQLLVENLVPAVAGALLGVVMARATLQLLVGYAGRFTVRAGEIAIDTTVLAVAIAVGLAAAAVLAWLPRLPHGEPGALVVSAGRSTSAGSSRRLQRALVAAQVALSFVLLVGSGLLLRTLSNLQAVEPGVETERLLAIELPGLGFDRPGDERLAFYDEVLARARALPGAASAALLDRVPLRPPTSALGAGGFEVAVEGRPREPGAVMPRAAYRVVSPGAFETLGVTLRSGRFFDGRDSAESTPAVVLNERAARLLFPDQDPVGRKVAWTGDVLRFIGLSGDWRTVVGVVSDIRDHGPDAAPEPSMFQPLAQEQFASVLLLETAGMPETLAATAQRMIRELNPEQPIEGVATLREVQREAIGPQRLNATLLLVFSGLAVAIAAVGVAGVLIFQVSARRRELAIRAALGADRQRLLRGILLEGAGLTLGGVAAGAVVAFAVTRFLRGMLFGVEPVDVLTYALVGLLLVIISVAAALVPARRASRTEPASVLRAE